MTAEAMLADLLEACVVQVHVDDRFAGSGVLVAPGAVLTCAHVVADGIEAGTELAVVHQGANYAALPQRHTPPGTPDGRAPDPYPWPDLAWLKVAALEGQTSWVEFDPVAPRPGYALVGRGFSQAFERGVPSGHPARYRVEGRVARADGDRWQLTDAQAAPGMSGSPLINTRTGRLTGLLTRSREADTDLGGWTVHALPGLVADAGFQPMLDDIETPRTGDASVRERWLEATGLRALLSAPYKPLPKRRTPATLLLARHGVVPFHPARQPALEELHEWCLGGESLVRLLTGPAGTGKTRLAAEFADQLATQGWLTGFLTGSAGSSDILGPLGGRRDPLLVVIDYAETQRDLPDLLAAVGRLDEDGATIRVLLLARAAGEWWQTLPTKGTAPQDAQGTLVGARATSLDQLDDLVVDPTPAYRDAAAALAERQELALPADLPALATGTTWSYLLAHLAALDAVGTRDQPGRPNPGGEPRSPEQVLDFVLAREHRHWRTTADAENLVDASDILLARVITALTLLGATDETDAATTLKRVPDLNDAPEEHRRLLARWVHHQYPPNDPEEGWTSGLQPDLLAETHVGVEARRDENVLDRMLSAATERQVYRALSQLHRAKVHQPHLAVLLAPVLRRNRSKFEPIAVAVVVTSKDLSRTQQTVAEIYDTVSLVDRPKIWRAEWMNGAEHDFDRPA